MNKIKDVLMRVVEKRKERHSSYNEIRVGAILIGMGVIAFFSVVSLFSELFHGRLPETNILVEILLGWFQWYLFTFAIECVIATIEYKRENN